jgi:hypothetical protein
MSALMKQLVAQFLEQLGDLRLHRKVPLHCVSRKSTVKASSSLLVLQPCVGLRFLSKSKNSITVDFARCGC